MDLRFLAPGFLVFLALALLPWVGPLATRDRRHAALRSLAFVLLALALARPVRVVADEVLHRVAVLDRSASVTDAADRAASEAVRALALAPALAGAANAGATHVTVVELGDGTRAPLALPREVRHLAVAAPAASPLGAALAAAARAIPPGARGSVVVHTDGLATEPMDGSAAARALADLAARGVTVDFALHPSAEGDLRPIGLAPRGALRAGLSTEVTARLVGGGQVVTCRLVDFGADGVRRELDVVEGVRVDGEVDVSLRFEPWSAGFVDVVLEVEVTDGVDARPDDLRLARTFAVDDPLRVLYVGERVAGGDAALAQLVGPGLALTNAGADLSLAQLAATDLVVLDDRPAARVPEGFQAALRDAIATRGLGLVAAGGEASFGPGGYHEQPLEELLPVEFVQKEEKRDPSTTLVVIIDTSGSMGGNRVQLAKEVARLAIRRLLPHDKVGMVEFYGAKRWAVPIQPASNSIEIERALNRLDAGGGTVILPAIEEAYYGLKNVRTRYKHVLILTDGGVETGAFEPLLRRMADEGMNVSTVLIGGDAHSEFLVTLSNWGQGRFYSVPNRFNLPEILLKQPASAKLPAYREGLASVRARGGEAWFGEVDPSTLPPVAGYVETRARPGAERVLETAAEGHPLLASWRYGLGRVTVLTTEPTGPGTAPWRASADYGAWLARALERTASDTMAPFAFELVRDGGEAVLIAERRLVDPDADGAAPWARLCRRAPPSEVSAISGYAGQSVPLEPERPEWTLRQVAPDRFEARLALDAGAELFVECGAVLGGAPMGAPRRLTLAPLTGAAAERQVPARAVDALLALAGRTHPALGAPPPAGVSRLRAFAPLLALLALCTYLLDIAYRRWPRRSASA